MGAVWACGPCMQATLGTSHNQSCVRSANSPGPCPTPPLCMYTPQAHMRALHSPHTPTLLPPTPPSPHRTEYTPREQYGARSDRPPRTDRPPTPPGCRLYVGNLSYNTTWMTLKDHFSSVGSVEFASVSKGPDGRPRGFGFVNMSSEGEAQAAIAQLNESELEGRNLVVNLYTPREQQQEM